MTEKLMIREMQNRLIDGGEFIIPFSKALSHPHRYQILVLLLDESHSFQFIKDQLHLGKTALANHLAHLSELDLISKPERGSYKITERGRSLLRMILDFYNQLKIRELNIAREVQAHLVKTENSSHSQNFMVSSPGKYQPSWISFLGAFFGVFQQFRCPWDLIDLGGISGYFFLVNVSKDRLCPSGPTALTSYIWKSMINALETLGFQIQSYFDLGKYPLSEDLTPEDKLRALKLQNWIKDQLIFTKHPLVVWGAPIPEFAIINGFEGDYYYASSFRTSVGIEEGPIHFEQLQAPGGLWAYSILPLQKENWNIFNNNRDYGSIKQGLKFLQKTSPEENYVLGVDAYDAWARNLLSNSDSESDFHGNSYVGEVLYEQKRYLSQYLSRLAHRYRSKPFSSHLQKAAEETAQIADLAKKFRDIFPFSLKGSFSLLNKKKGAAILRSIIPFEESTIDSLKSCLNLWNP